MAAPLISGDFIECPSCHESIRAEEYLSHTLYHHPFFFSVWAAYSFPALDLLSLDGLSGLSSLGSLNGLGDLSSLTDYGFDYEQLSELCETIGNHEVGVPDIASVTTEIQKSDLGEHAETRCPICLDAPNSPEGVYRKINRCSHTFCSPCIEQWLSTHKTCPICKQEAPEDTGSP